MDIFVIVTGTLLILLIGAAGLRAASQLRNFRPLPDAPIQEQQRERPLVSVIIPARNEEASIRRCVESYLQQDHPAGRAEILVVDDCSQDQTAAIVGEIAEVDPRVRLVSISSLPTGWLGKPHACWQGFLHAKGEWLLFTDADTWADPTLIRSAVAYAEAHGVDCVSLAPAQEAGGFWERVVLPAAALLTAAAVATDIRAFNEDARPEGAAFGAFILVRREAYETIVGHKAVAGQVVEDIALGRALKAGGYRLRLLDGGRVIRVRMYSGLGEIWEGFSKNMASLAGSTGRAVAIALTTLMLAWASVALLVYGMWSISTGQGNPVSAAASAVGMAAFGAALVFHASLSRRMAIRLWAAHALLFPLAYTVVALIMLNSALRKNRGSLKWKGRAV